MNLGFFRAGTAMKYQVKRVISSTSGRLNQGLGVFQNLGPQLDVTGFVDTVNVAK